MYTVDIDTSSKGAVLSGRGFQVTQQYTLDVQRETAQTALADVHFTLDRVIRDPTPIYENQIRLDRQGSDEVVHDGRWIYGPWLEGTGSRNRTTRFKGYFSFRRVAGQLNFYKVPRIMQQNLADCLARLNA